jgi:hypothetical protein
MAFPSKKYLRRFWKDGRGSPKVCCMYCGREARLIIAMIELLIIILSLGERMNLA